MPWSFCSSGRREEIGEFDAVGSCLFEIVVRSSREHASDDLGGSRPRSSERSSEMVVVGGRAIDRVGGRPVPEKLVTKTFILLGVSILC